MEQKTGATLRSSRRRLPSSTLQRTALTVVLATASSWCHAPAQSKEGTRISWAESGIPRMRNFAPKEYQAHEQNWCVVQDSRGIMYFGNTIAILEYDGSSWRMLKMPNGYVVRSLCIVNDRVFVGGQNELGYLTADDHGNQQYRSLLDLMPEEKRQFQDVWEIRSVGDEVFFRTTKDIFRLADGRITGWASGQRFHRAFSLDNSLYVHISEKGLMRRTSSGSDSLELIPGSEQFKGDLINIMLRLDSSCTLIGSLKQLLFMFDGNSIVPFPTEADSYLKENELYNGALLPGGFIALCTRRGGLVVLDTTGKLCQIITKASGLRDNKVNFCYVDNEGGLWLALNNGIARVDPPAPLSFFLSSSGIDGNVESIIRHQGRIYIGTSQGVYYLDSVRYGSTRGAHGSSPERNSANGLHFPVFRPVEGISSFCWGLASVGKHLLVAQAGNVYDIVDGKASTIETPWGRSRSILRSRIDTNRVYVGVFDGLAVLQLRNNKWVDLGKIEGVTEKLFDIAEDPQGTLWLGSFYQGVVRVDFPTMNAPAETVLQHARVSRYTMLDGFPDGETSPGIISGRVVVATQRGLMRFDESKDKFVPDSTYGPSLADTASHIFRFWEDPTGGAWFLGNAEKKLLNGKASRLDDGSLVWDEEPFALLTTIGEPTYIYPERDETVWIGGVDGIARYLPRAKRIHATEYRALVRKVSVKSDSIVFGGIPSDDGERNDGIYPALPYYLNDLHFEFASISYDDPASTLFQVKLDGFDKDWEWTSSFRKEYTWLSEGTYVFRVRAKNAYNRLSSEARFAFTILPPWYREWWAFALYALAALGLVSLIVKVRIRRLQEQKKELEAVVAERTAEVIAQKNRIEEQAEGLKELDRAKSRFFANISHEFRTPLTLILGPLHDLIARTQDVTSREEMRIMHRNASRLLQLINQLLDLSRLESGALNLRAAPGKLVEFLRWVTYSFSSLAEQRHINLRLHGLDESLELEQTYYDADKLEKIIVNLISNAFKFTPESGIIGVDFRREEGGFVTISVSNTGEGISPEHLPHIFDRFYQADSSSTRRYEGSGIGLALTRELVETCHGTISVRSVVGEETAFEVRLPVTRTHFASGEISEEAQEVAGVRREGGITEEPSPDPSTVTVFFPSGQSATPETVILLVEDNPEVRRFIRSHIPPEYRVLEAGNGREALQLATAEIPSLVVSDVMMPEMDGFALCHAMKTDEKTSHIPVILLTARAAEESRIEGLQTGADDYLVKPFSPGELQVRVRNLIQSRSELRKRFSGEMLLQPQGVVVTSVHAAFLTRVMDVVETHLGDEEFDVHTLSEKLAMTQRQLHRKLTALTNQTPSEFIRCFRLHRARQLIEQQAGTVSEIAYRVGITNLSYFSKCFKEQFGVLPSGIKSESAALPDNPLFAPPAGT